MWLRLTVIATSGGVSEQLINMNYAASVGKCPEGPSVVFDNGNHIKVQQLTHDIARMLSVGNSGK